VRVSELIGLTVASVERDRQQALLKVRAGAKGGTPRNVPIPRRTLTDVDAYLNERAAWRGPVTDRSRPFVRHDSSPLTQQLIDRTLRRIASTATVTPPEGAMAHALRDACGMDLAIAGRTAVGHPAAARARPPADDLDLHSRPRRGLFSRPCGRRCTWRLASQRLPLACGASPLVGRSAQCRWASVRLTGTCAAWR
jgi:hypothetical protein